MRHTRIYCHLELDVGSDIQLDRTQSHHLTRVLRARTGDQIKLFNGDGCDYSGEIISAERDATIISLSACEQLDRESNLKITLLQGVSRNDRMDTTIQKSVELGVNRIIPIITDRVNHPPRKDRLQKKFDHWKQIIISACEQSGRAIIPELMPCTQFNEAIEVYKSATNLTLDPTSSRALRQLTPQNDDFTITIGPEGGLSESELEEAARKGFVSIRMGERILRTETAGPACITGLQVLWGDLG